MMQSKGPAQEYYDFLESPVGRLCLIFRRSYLVGISFGPSAEIPMRHGDASEIVKAQLTEYFRNERSEFSCRTAFLEGTEFEKRVWNVLRRIPYGETRSYKWVAAEIGEPKAARAVGNALGKNPIPIIFPCHRIIESDGSIGGYTPGTDIKRRLLGIEYYTAASRR
ncbi:MAG: methylated-DNA--[protein]-cysteine S-methyltransferase [Nitrospiraceae bacterium]|nr:methylated-DNA--[protein]-cysteine S-methyltransferase [Nitrospiraceae bacterium]